MPDRSAVRNALLDLDAKSAAEEEAARAEERGSAEERSAAAAAAHAHVREHAHVQCSPVDSYSVTQVRAAGGFAGAGDRGGEAQGTTRREFAGVIWIQRSMRMTRTRVRRATTVRTVKRMMTSAETGVFHCCCSGQESGERRLSGDGGVSLSGIDSGYRREAMRHLFPGPVDARGERDD